MTRRELRILEAHLEASILAERDASAGGPLAAAIAEHQALRRERKTREAARTGFGWLGSLERVAATDEAVALNGAGASGT